MHKCVFMDNLRDIVYKSLSFHSFQVHCQVMCNMQPDPTNGHKNLPKFDTNNACDRDSMAVVVCCMDGGALYL